MKTKRTFLPAAFKVFLALASFTGTIGLWSLFTNKDLSTASGNGDSVTPGSVIVDLPAIPTLVPLIIVDDHARLANQGSGPDATVLRNIQAPARVNQTANITNSNPVILPAPVTNTRSSK